MCVVVWAKDAPGQLFEIYLRSGTFHLLSQKAYRYITQCSSKRLCLCRPCLPLKGFHLNLHPELSLSVNYTLYNIIHPFSLCLSFRQGAGKQEPVDQGRERAECHREPDQLYDGASPGRGGIFPRPDFRHPLAIT